MLSMKGLGSAFGTVLVSSLFLLSGPVSAKQPDEFSNLLKSYAPEAKQIESGIQKHGHVRVIVRLKDAQLEQISVQQGVESPTYYSTLSATQDNVMSVLSAEAVQSHKRFKYVPSFAATVTQSDLTALMRHPNVAMIEVDELATPSLNTSTAIMGAQQAWASGYTGENWNVAILDTGIEHSHPAFAGKITAEACFSYSYPAGGMNSLCAGGEWNEVGLGSAPDCSGANGCGHGTHVAGIATGNDENHSGVAKNSGVIPIQVFTRFENESSCGTGRAPCVMSYSSDQMLALEFVFEKRHELNIASANLSLGGGAYFQHCDAERASYAELVSLLADVGIATVIASGNDGQSQYISAPACISSAVSVGSTTNGDTAAEVDHVSYFSNAASILDVLAPGQVITAAYPGNSYAGLQGTSMAAPHVAGCYALIRSAGGEYSAEEVLGALKASGKSIYDRRNGRYFPRIDCAAAIEQLRAPKYTPLITGVRLVERTATTLGFVWDALPGATSYNGEVSLSENFADAEYFETSAPNITIEGLQPGTRHYFRLQAVVDGEPTGFTNETTGYFSTLRNFSLNEVLDVPEIFLESWGTKQWVPDETYVRQGANSLVSGDISHNEWSEVYTEVVGPATLTFDYKVSSEAGWDFFYVQRYSNDTVIDELEVSGEVDWQTHTIELGEGSHEIYFWYVKDVSIDGGEDKAWLDNFVFSRSSDVHEVRILPNGGALYGSTKDYACIGECVAAVADGETLEISPYSYNGLSLSSWGGACSGTAATENCVLTVTEDVMVTAEWEYTLRTYDITVSTSGNGTASAVNTTVNHGQRGFINYVPASGHVLNAITSSCGGDYIGTMYQTDWVYDDCEVQVEFTPKKYRIDTRVTGPGSVYPTYYWVEAGETPSFEVIPNAEGKLSSFSGCGVSEQNESLVVAPVVDECLLDVVFDYRTYTVTFDLGDYGIRTGGGELVQEVIHGTQFVVPEFAVHPAFNFLGWYNYEYYVYNDITVIAAYSQVSNDIDAYQAVEVTIMDGDALYSREEYQVPWGSDFAHDFAAAGVPLARRVEGSCPVGVWSGSVYTAGPIIAHCALLMSVQDKPGKRSILPLIINLLEEQDDAAGN